MTALHHHRMRRLGVASGHTSPAATAAASAPATRRSTALRAAVLMATVAVVLQPFLHPTGPGNSSPVDVVILLAILAFGLWASTAPVRLRAPYLFGFGLMILAGAAAGLAGPLPGTALLTLLQDLVLLLWCTLVTNLARQRGVLRILSVAWAVSSICWATVLVVASLTGLTVVEGFIAADGNRALFTFGDPNYAADFWVASIFVVYATQAPRRRWLRLLGYVLLIWSLLLTESNGGVLELLVGCGLVLLVLAYRRYGLMTAAAAVLVVATVVGGGLTAVPFAQIQTWARNSNVSLLVNSLGRSNQSSSERGTLIQETMQLYASDGLLGSGPASTKPILAQRQYPYANEAHDDYLAVLVERGPLGLLGLLIVVVAAAYRCGQVLRGPPKGWAELPRPVGLVAALATLALSGTFEEVQHFRFLWLLLALTAATAARTPAKPTQADLGHGDTTAPPAAPPGAAPPAAAPPAFAGPGAAP